MTDDCGHAQRPEVIHPSQPTMRPASPDGWKDTAPVPQVSCTGADPRHPIPHHIPRHSPCLPAGHGTVAPSPHLFVRASVQAVVTGSTLSIHCAASPKPGSLCDLINWATGSEFLDDLRAVVLDLRTCKRFALDVDHADRALSQLIGASRTNPNVRIAFIAQGSVSLHRLELARRTLLGTCGILADTFPNLAAAHAWAHANRTLRPRGGHAEIG